MAHEQALGGCPDSDLFTRKVTRVGIKGHTDVGTDNIDHGLPVLGIVLREAFKGIQSTKPHRYPVVSELFYRPRVQLSNPALRCIEGGVPRDMLTVRLSTKSEQ